MRGSKRIVSLAPVLIAAPLRAEPPGEELLQLDGRDGPADRIALDLSLRYESSYYFRGLPQRTDSINLQPAATLKFRLSEADEPLSVSALGGVWNNFSDDTAPGAAGGFHEHWYEADIFTGLALSYERWSLSAVYTWYLSPSSDFDDYEDITFTLAFADAGLWDEGERFSLNPSVSVAVETDGAADGLDSGTWFGAGLRPSYVVGDTPLGGLTVAAPLYVGLGADGYYETPDGSSSTFGWFEVGAVAAFKLSDALGPAAPTLDLGVRWLFLGDAPEAFNGGDDDEVIVSVGLTWSF